MTKELKNILVFKTNIRTMGQLLCVKSILDNHPAIQDWSIDQQDIDCVLRVVTPALASSDIINIISSHGFMCTELD